MAQAVEKPDPASLVARIIAELEANPAAQRLLLRALLTNEFRGMPLRLDRIAADIREMKVDIRKLKTDVAGLKTDVADLKGDCARRGVTGREPAVGDAGHGRGSRRMGRGRA